MVAPETARAPSLPRTRAEMKIVESRVGCGKRPGSTMSTLSSLSLAVAAYAIEISSTDLVRSSGRGMESLFFPRFENNFLLRI